MVIFRLGERQFLPTTSKRNHYNNDARILDCWIRRNYT